MRMAICVKEMFAVFRVPDMLLKYMPRLSREVRLWLGLALSPVEVRAWRPGRLSLPQADPRLLEPETELPSLTQTQALEPEIQVYVDDTYGWSDGVKSEGSFTQLALRAHDKANPPSARAWWPPLHSIHPPTTRASSSLACLC